MLKKSIKGSLIIIIIAGGGQTRKGDGGSIFWKTREIGLPSYSNNLSTIIAYCSVHRHVRKNFPTLPLIK